MEPVPFKQTNRNWGGAGYLDLPAYTNDTGTISCWKLSWYERCKLLLTGRLWLRQMNLGQALQPQCPQVESPFDEDKSWNPEANRS